MSQIKFNPESTLWMVEQKDIGTRASRVVNVNWNGSNWNVNDWNRDGNSWNSGNRVFSPENDRFLPAILSGVFVYNI